jgi:uncharacterized protein YjbI with pentapeptide repeats
MFRFLLFALCLATVAPALALSAPQADPAAIASIKAGHHDCPHCELAFADLTNTCVKHGNVQGADFEGATLVLMCMSYADFRGSNFHNADLSGANLAHANVDGADFSGAQFSITSLKGTDLRRAKGLSQNQIDLACSDADTRLPQGLTAHFCH